VCRSAISLLLISLFFVSYLLLILWLSFRPVRNLTYEDIWKLVSSVAQSASGIDIAESFIIRVCRGTGGTRRGVESFNEDVAKRSILEIGNSDNLCFPRSLVAARVHYKRSRI
jgi:hypothetical protein